MMKIWQSLKRLWRYRPLKNYVSDFDKFLQNFKRKHPKLSASQQAEIKKYDRIAKLRDNPIRKEKKGKLWEKF